MSNECKYEAELTEAANHLQKIHPMGHCMGIGLLCVAQAIKEVGEDFAALKEQLREAVDILQAESEKDMSLDELTNHMLRINAFLMQNAALAKAEAVNETEATK